MNFKTHNLINAKQLKRFKLYKPGKLWLIAGVTFCSFVGSATINDTNAHADTNNVVLPARAETSKVCCSKKATISPDTVTTTKGA
ncbi:KxYKxGKxW signal peptide domain-containing protein [Lactiplantibacillus plantarum]